MARLSRKESYSNFYHVMTRGINKDKIFETESNKKRLFYIIQEKNSEIGCQIYSYCIMDNHLHLLVKADLEDLSLLMKKINGTYAMHYNLKEERIGPVFQDRFKSEAVEDNRYLLSVLKYIHQNPLKAGLVKDIREYKWSSYIEYLYTEGIINSNMGSNNILILIPLLKGNEIKNIKEETFALLENLKEKLQKEGINYNIAVGNYYPELEGIKTSYREILETFAIIEKLKIRNKIYFTFDKNLEILISSIRKELIGNYKYHFLNNEETVKLFQDKKTLDTLDAFFDSNFNTTISSRKLNITRNTLNNRLDKVKRVTGYDPKVFNDAIKLKILLIIDEIRD